MFVCDPLMNDAEFDDTLPLDFSILCLYEPYIPKTPSPVWPRPAIKQTSNAMYQEQVNECKVSLTWNNKTCNHLSYMLFNKRHIVPPDFLYNVDTPVCIFPPFRKN